MGKGGKGVIASPGVKGVKVNEELKELSLLYLL